MYHIVHFHADGGQMCAPGVRCFKDDSVKAALFAEKQRNIPGHTCKDSVREETSETPVQQFGLTIQELEEGLAVLVAKDPKPLRHKGFLSCCASVLFGD